MFKEALILAMAAQFNWASYNDRTDAWLEWLQPPEQYQGVEPRADIREWSLLCGNRVACAVGQGQWCTIYIWSGLDARTREYVLGHEYGHCNGWNRFHTGGLDPETEPEKY